MRPLNRMFSYFVFLKIQMESPFSFTEVSQFYFNDKNETSGFFDLLGSNGGEACLLP